VCSEILTQHPYYFHYHPGCLRNDTCAGLFFTCNAKCPAPGELEKQPPPGACDGSPGGFEGCRGNGCAVCAEKLVGFPNYFRNHPLCLRNDTCAGQFFTCNSKCPPPGPADR
jgi:hypothetical protein